MCNYYRKKVYFSFLLQYSRRDFLTHLYKVKTSKYPQNNYDSVRLFFVSLKTAIVPEGSFEGKSFCSAAQATISGMKPRILISRFLSKYSALMNTRLILKVSRKTNLWPEECMVMKGGLIV